MLTSYTLDGVPVHSSAMRRALDLCWLYAPLDAPVLFVGPVGSGKTSLAEVLHAHSERSGELIAVSGGELGGELYRSLLFGHERGAFTGADARVPGLLTLAAGGTLLLDDLALAPLGAQSAILRVLDRGRYRLLGTSMEAACSARWAFGSTVELKALVAEGRMLPDLKSRLGALIVEVPPLSARLDDILTLARTFVERTLAETHGRTTRVVLHDDTKSLLLRYDWPENVRELSTVMFRAAVHAGHQGLETTIRPTHLPLDLQMLEGVESAGRKQVRSELVYQAWIEADKSQAKAARTLGLHRNTVARHIRRYAALRR
jgi:DNA-binding NtrC family response regulator